MKNTARYIFVCLVWGITWYILKYHAMLVAPFWVAAYRFAIASLFLFIFCFFTKRSLYLTKTQHKFALLQGLFLFCLNYAFYYMSAKYLVSGIIPLIVASITLMNAFNAYFFLKRKIESNVILGSIIGLAGLFLIFNSTLKGTLAPEETMIQLMGGVFLVIAGTYMASLGNIISSHTQTQFKGSLLVSNAFGMAYGTFFLVVLALASGEKFTFPFTTPFISSLLFISLLGTAIAFHFYLTLLKELGPVRVAYIIVINPIIAMGISMLFEDFHITYWTVLGIIIASVGNIIVLKRKTENIKLEKK